MDYMTPEIKEDLEKRCAEIDARDDLSLSQKKERKQLERDIAELRVEKNREEAREKRLQKVGRMIISIICILTPVLLVCIFMAYAEENPVNYSVFEFILGMIAGGYLLVLYKKHTEFWKIWLVLPGAIIITAHILQVEMSVSFQIFIGGIVVRAGFANILYSLACGFVSSRDERFFSAGIMVIILDIFTIIRSIVNI